MQRRHQGPDTLGRQVHEQSLGDEQEPVPGFVGQGVQPAEVQHRGGQEPHAIGLRQVGAAQGDHLVSYAMVQQISLASTEYPKGVNEFIKAGFTQVPSVWVKPPRVKEAPVAFECRVLQVIPTGEEGGAGNLVICEVLSMYINDVILDEDGRIDPTRLDAVARLGGDWYCRVSGDSLFKIPKPLEKFGIGFDQLPEHILKSKVLTGNDLGKLSSVERVPEDTQLDEKSTLAFRRAQLQGEEAVHKLAQEYLEQGRVEEAWRILLAGL